ncbi:MAG: signal peptidase II [Thioalkalispiraceae bacterium]
MLKWLWIALVVIVLDQITKQLASNLLEMYQPVALMPMFNWTLMHNTGAAFSFLSDQAGWQRWFFTLIALLVSAVLIAWTSKLKANEKGQAIAFALVLGGALGNVIDRIAYGYVIDFIDVYYKQWHWPAFNIADSAISIGVVLLIIESFRQHKREGAGEGETKHG